MDKLPANVRDNLFKLEFLGMIKRNQKVCMYDYSLVDSKSLIGSIKRSLMNETRDSNIREINNIINESISLINEYKDTEYFPLMMGKLIKAKDGVTTLQITYADDPKTISLINVIIDELSLNIEKFSTE